MIPNLFSCLEIELAGFNRCLLPLPDPPAEFECLKEANDWANELEVLEVCVEWDEELDIPSSL